MQAHHLVGAAHGGGHGGDAQAGRIGGEDAAGGNDAVQLRENGTLDVQILHGGLDDHVGLGGILHVQRADDAGEGRIAVFGGHLAPGHELVPGASDALQTFVDEFLLYIVEIHGETVQRGHLSDAAAHGPCTYHKKGLHNHLLFGMKPFVDLSRFHHPRTPDAMTMRWTSLVPS